MEKDLLRMDVGASVADERHARKRRIPPSAQVVTTDDVFGPREAQKMTFEKMAKQLCHLRGQKLPGDRSLLPWVAAPVQIKETKGAASVPIPHISDTRGE